VTFKLQNPLPMNFSCTFLHDYAVFPTSQEGEPWGLEQVAIALAGAIYRCAGLSHRQATALRQRFGPLLISPRESAQTTETTTIDVFRADPDDFRAITLKGWEVTFDFAFAPNAVAVAGLYCMARLDWMPKLKVALWIPAEDGLMDFSTFENILRMVVAYRLLDEGGVLLHSAAVANPAGAHVFFGPSGAGKSTISRLGLDMGYEVLSDDLNALRISANQVIVDKLPFAGDLGQNATLQGTYPVRSLCRLHKGPEPALENLRPAAALAALSASAPFVNRNPFRQNELIDKLSLLNERLPIQALTFARDNGFWHLLSPEE
jgi:hypothetical protein